MITELVSCLDHTLTFLGQQVADLSDEEMLLQPSGAPNHAAWTWLPGDWESRFGYGSVPGLQMSGFSDKSTLLAALADASNRLKNALLGTDERSLARPIPDEEAREVMPTMGHILMQVIVGHTAFHAGQLAAWRRAIGRAPVGVFI
jgi:hypothetical protein